MKGPFGFSEDLGKSEMCVCVSFCGQYAWTRVCVLFGLCDQRWWGVERGEGGILSGISWR